jgi:hypothetical protein
MDTKSFFSSDDLVFFVSIQKKRLDYNLVSKITIPNHVYLLKGANIVLEYTILQSVRISPSSSHHHLGQ